MKSYIQLILAGVIGGLIVLGGLNVDILRDKDQKDLEYRATQVGYNMSPTRLSTNMPNDFVESAKKSTGSVVHIFAEESDELAMQNRKKNRSRNPFGDFFSMDDFFEGNFYSPKKGSGSGDI